MVNVMHNKKAWCVLCTRQLSFLMDGVAYNATLLT